MSVVVFEQFMMDVVVGRGTDSDHRQVGVPPMNKLRMDQGKPARVKGTKGNIRSMVGVNDLRGDVQRDDDHGDGIQHGPMKGVKQRWIGKPVMMSMCNFIQ